MMSKTCKCFKLPFVSRASKERLKLQVINMKQDFNIALENRDVELDVVKNRMAKVVRDKNDLENDLKEAKAQFDSMLHEKCSELEVVKRQVAETAHDKDVLENCVTGLEQSKAGLKARIAEMKQEFDDALTSKESQLNAAEKQLEVDNADSWHKINELDEKLQQKDVALDISKMQNQEFRDLNSDLLKRIDILEQENIRLNGKLDQTKQNNLSLLTKVSLLEKQFVDVVGSRFIVLERRLVESMELGKQLIECSEESLTGFNESTKKCKKLFDANTKCSAFVDCVLRRAVEAHNSKKYSEFIQQQLLKAIGVEEVSSRNGNWILGRLWNELGINLGCGFKRYRQAITSFTEAIGYVPGNAVFHFNRACAFDRLERSEEAIEDLKHTLHLDPISTEAKNLLESLRKKYLVDLL